MRIVKRICRMILLLVLLVGMTWVYACKIEPFRLVVKEYHINEEKQGSVTLRVVQFSDTEISLDYSEEELERAVIKINEKNPDIVVFTGDLFNNYAVYQPKERVIDILHSIQATYGKYAIWGNKDYGGGAGRQYADIMEQSGFILLENEGVTIDLPGEKHLFLGGLDDELLGNHESDWMENVDFKSYDYRMMMFHEPDMADELTDYPLDLILAGHSHGGQVRIPLAWESELLPQYNYMDGFYSLGAGKQLYVNSGMGTSRMQVRFLVPPQITVFYISI